MKGLKLLIPPSYFIFTRLNNLKELFYHSYYEWLIGIIIIYFLGHYSALHSILNFSMGYLAFISVYEIGYLINDVYVVKNEMTPRLRLGDYSPSVPYIILWVLVRFLIFVFLSYHLKALYNVKWLGFYLILLVSFAFHNFIQNKDLKVVSFASLALLRFFAPIFLFISDEIISLLLPCILLNYVLYRTLSYMDSKSLILMKTRNTPQFRMYYYIVLMPISIWLSLQLSSAVPLYINIYYFFYIIFYLKKGIN